MKNTVQHFKEQLQKMRAFQHAMGIMHYDMETVMPKGAASTVGETLGILSKNMYHLQTDSRFLEDITRILENPNDVDPITFLEAKRMNESRARIACIPVEEYVEYQIVQTAASSTWRAAKLENDYQSFLPYLEKLIDYSRRFALYYKPDNPVYDTLLDKYEKGLNTSFLNRFFTEVRTELVPVIAAIIKKKYQPDTSFLNQIYPIYQQKKLTAYLMKTMRMDPAHSVCGEVEHPFTTSFTKSDVRITTHYHENAVESSMYSVIHEAGHATYELNISDELARSPLGGGASMSVHESQSRFFENIIGRSEPFITYLFPKLVELFPQQLANITSHDFYLAVNKAEPSLIRTQADELTYPLHILIRYELEKQLIGGTLSAKDLPDAWNAMYKEYLGINVPNDTKGVLQDSHWSGGSFGYFPSYALGSAYGAQLIKQMEKDIPVWDFVESGNLQPLIDWLTNRIYRYGKMLEPKQLIEQAMGAPFDPKYYTNYLTRKYTALYHL